MGTRKVSASSKSRSPSKSQEAKAAKGNKKKSDRDHIQGRITARSESAAADESSLSAVMGDEVSEGPTPPVKPNRSLSRHMSGAEKARRRLDAPTQTETSASDQEQDTNRDNLDDGVRSGDGDDDDDDDDEVSL
jgi:hypothetical protein